MQEPRKNENAAKDDFDKEEFMKFCAAAMDDLDDVGEKSHKQFEVEKIFWFIFTAVNFSVMMYSFTVIVKLLTA